MQNENSDFTAIFGCVYLVDTTDGNITVNLPDTIGNDDCGAIFINIGVNQINFIPVQGQLINGAPTFTNSTQWTANQLACSGGNWYSF